ncbi:hypothetical protein LTR94_036449, partial [Friedmanniomyces endolithicus]
RRRGQDHRAGPRPRKARNRREAGRDPHVRCAGRGRRGRGGRTVEGRGRPCDRGGRTPAVGGDHRIGAAPRRHRDDPGDDRAGTEREPVRADLPDRQEDPG